MSTLTRRDYRKPFTDIVEWLEAPLALIRPVAGHPMPVEDYVQDGRYVLRAELPGIDPETDLTVTASNGVLTIKAERLDKTEGAHHSEFRYGTFARSVRLPVNADDAHIQASYGHGVLEIAVPLREAGEGERHIPVLLDRHIRPT
jgi:HSP20 family protein